jgi:hypothetical protein
MLFVVWMPLFLQLLLPLGLLGWLAFGHPGSRLAWALGVCLVASYLAAITVAGLWLVFPWYTSVVYAVTLLFAALHSGRQLRDVPRLPSGPRGVVIALTLGIAAASCAVLFLWVDRGRRPPARAVELSFPLRSGTFLIVNGGGNELINAHLKTLAGTRFRPWRGQSYGVDIEKLDALGFRARGILPHDLAAYEIFGETIYAPCTGTVLRAVDGVPEMRPPAMDRRRMEGNHVVIGCSGVWVLLGHMRVGSVAVRRGDSVVAGEPLGRVGNTGNTGEPHLHIHAQLPGTRDAPWSGEPLPIRFGAIFPSRNTRIRS